MNWQITWNISMFNFSKTSPNISTEDPRHPPTTGPASSLAPNSQSSAGTMVKVEYSFIDLEHRLGLAQASLYIHIYTHTHICNLVFHIYLFWWYFLIQQMIEALSFLHTNCKCIHRNICPHSIYVTKSGTWKLGGLEFLGNAYIISKTVDCLNL